MGKRPVPSRTRKLSPPAPMVLHPPGCGRVGRRRTPLQEGPPEHRSGGLSAPTKQHDQPTFGPNLQSTNQRPSRRHTTGGGAGRCSPCWSGCGGGSHGPVRVVRNGRSGIGWFGRGGSGSGGLDGAVRTGQFGRGRSDGRFGTVRFGLCGRLDRLDHLVRIQPASRRRLSGLAVAEARLQEALASSGLPVAVERVPALPDARGPGDLADDEPAGRGAGRRVKPVSAPGRSRCAPARRR